MAILRTASRLLLAGIFANDGLDAALHPDDHLYEFQVAQQTWEHWGIPPLPPADQRAWVRGSGILATVLAAGLAAGKMPRTCALGLAALSVPIALVRYPPTESHTGKPLARRMAITAWLLMHASVGEGRLRLPARSVRPIDE
ncbi:DoxX family membrane protein [Nanchangia anserum]|uniref:DoxX family membrane protein n=1 Tax=Nanchangia anserum TaxID=2692125 RepID=A0A8I0KWJ2_9ACTO|nr:DoxX family membrane protein [Nanchangia anserum]MBD3690054.1 DoxX family membrane protein [Nanchangia anserum]QOX82152.1 DoxX family membrane protein [Nanchangia anserum]